MFKDLLDDLSNDSMGLEAVVESELVSKRLKSMILNHKSVVSERDISTLNYNLSRIAVQEQGLKIIDDFFYPYLVSDHYDPNLVEKALGLVKTFYDIYGDSEVLLAVTDYLKNDEEFKNIRELFNLSSSLILNAGSTQRLPRSFTRLLLKDMSLKSSHAFLEDDLEFVPAYFKEKVRNAKCRVYSSDSFAWSSELELYEHSWSKDISFENFSNPISEIRWALSKLKKTPEINIFYPPNLGYESLFLIYQKEFFENQVISYESNDQIEIKRILKQLSVYIQKINSKYEGNEITNYIRFNNFDFKKIEFQDFIIEHLKSARVDNQTLNFMSEIITNLESDFKLSFEQWFELIEKKYLEDINKKQGLITDFNIYKYGEPPRETDQNSIVLGWGSDMFKRQIQNWISPQLIFKLENDLGLKSKSLFKTPAHDLIKFLPRNSANIIATYPKISLKGESRHQGLLKILKKQNNFTQLPKRVFTNIEQNKSYKAVEKIGELKLSSSSLNSYYTCPQKYYLEKNIGLSKEELPDYSLSPKDEGALMHKIMEELGKHSIEFDMFCQIVSENLSSDGNFELWRKSQAEEVADKLWSFFSKENAFLASNKIKPKFLEKDFVFYLDTKNETFSLEPGINTVAIRGIIDRVDEDEFGNILLYDYKRSSSGSYLVSRYEENSPLNPQAFIYYLAAELGCLGEHSAMVGFQFINLSLGKREKGFLFKDLIKESSLVYEKSGLIDKVKFDEKIKLFKHRLFSTIKNIEDNNFEAKPAKEGECNKCDWRGVCKKTVTFI